MRVQGPRGVGRTLACHKHGRRGREEERRAGRPEGELHPQQLLLAAAAPSPELGGAGVSWEPESAL